MCLRCQRAIVEHTRLLTTYLVLQNAHTSSSGAGRRLHRRIVIMFRGFSVSLTIDQLVGRNADAIVFSSSTLTPRGINMQNAYEIYVSLASVPPEFSTKISQKHLSAFYCLT